MDLPAERLVHPSQPWAADAPTSTRWNRRSASTNSPCPAPETTAAAQTGISSYLLAAANTSGGVLGKTISPQNLAIAAAVVGMEHKVGMEHGMEHKESALFRKVIWWSLGLLLGMCVLVYLQSTPVLGWMVVG